MNRSQLSRSTCRSAALLAFLTLTGCSSAEPEWYRLTIVPGRPAATGPRSVELRDVSLARYLVRPGIVRAGEGTQLAVEDNQRWASPLDQMTTEVLSRDLQLRLPDSTILGERGAFVGAPDLFADVGIDRFEADAEGRVVLSARFVIRRGADGRLVRQDRLDEQLQPPAPGMNALVQAQSELLGRLADRLTETLSNPTETEN